MTATARIIRFDIDREPKGAAAANMIEQFPMGCRVRVPSGRRGQVVGKLDGRLNVRYSDWRPHESQFVMLLPHLVSRADD